MYQVSNFHLTVLTLYPNIMLCLFSCTSSLLCKSFKELFLFRSRLANFSAEPLFVPESECKSTAFIFNGQEKHGKNFTFFSWTIVLALSNCRNTGTFWARSKFRDSRMANWRNLGMEGFFCFFFGKSSFFWKNTKKVWLHGGIQVKKFGILSSSEGWLVRNRWIFCGKTGNDYRKT